MRKRRPELSLKADLDGSSDSRTAIRERGGEAPQEKKKEKGKEKILAKVVKGLEVLSYMQVE